MNRNDLLEEAARRYPPGTEYYAAYLAKSAKSKCIVKPDDVFMFEWDSEETIINKNRVYNEFNICNCIRKHDQWAEIIPPKPEDLIKEAERRYPLGTKFISADDRGRTREVQPFGKESTVIWRYWDVSKEIRCENGMYIEDIKGRSACSNPHIYKNGVWAEIVKPGTRELSETSDIAEPEAESNLEKAERLYHAGVTYIPRGYERDKASEVSTGLFGQTSEDIWVTNQRGYIFWKGTWAKIEPPLLEPIPPLLDDIPAKLNPGEYLMVPKDCIPSIHRESSVEKLELTKIKHTKKPFTP